MSLIMRLGKNSLVIVMILLSQLKASSTLAQNNPWVGPACDGILLTADSMVKHILGNNIFVANAQRDCWPDATGAWQVAADAVGIGLNQDKILIMGTKHYAELLWQNFFEYGYSGGGAAENGYGGSDTDLQNLLFTLGDSTPNYNVDRCVLEFDMVPVVDTIQFRYVFATSASYARPCDASINNIMGIFIQGNEYPTLTNFATVPGTSLPVCAVTIADTPAYNGFDCADYCEGCPHVEYFVDNYLGPAWIGTSGYTVPLMAKAAVTPCDTYHIKIAIAARCEWWSQIPRPAAAVFLEAYTNDSVSSTLGAQAWGSPGMGNAPATTCRECAPAQFVLRRTGDNQLSKIVNYTLSGSAVNGFDYVSLPSFAVIPAGEDSVVLPLQALIADNPDEDDTVVLTITNNQPACLVNGSLSDTIIIKSHTTGIQKVVDELSGIRFRPNPFSSELVMEVPANLANRNWQLQLCEPTGRIHGVLKGNVTAINQQLTAWQHLPNGVWLLQIMDTQSRHTAIRKLVKE